MNNTYTRDSVSLNKCNENTFSITTSQLLEYLFCPRFTYFEYVLGIAQNEETRFKVQKGREIHENFRKLNPQYLRKKIGVIKKESDVYLFGPPGIRGIVDEILYLNDGTAAPLDYKYAEYKNKIFKTYLYQLVYYAKLIQDNFNISVNRGYIVYAKSKNKLIEILIADKEYSKLNKMIDELFEIMNKCKYPKPTASKLRCADCCYRNICEQII